MKTYLLSIAIGPVQDFIAAARKTRDLHYGSWLLSELSKACARHLLLKEAKLIFPSSDDLTRDLSDTKFTAPNKILALVSAEDEPGVKLLASNSHEAAQKWLKQEYAAMEQRLKDLLSSNCHYDGDLGRGQIVKAVEFYAAWEEIRDGYENGRKNVEKRMAARKALRDFEWHKGSNRPKSSLDGFRETVIVHGEGKPNKFFIQPKELLDGVGLLKRMARMSANRFYSTHDIAAASFVLKARRSAPQALDDYDAVMRKLDREKVAPPSYSHVYHDELKDPPEELTRVVKALRELKPVTPYYGLFTGDGDFMARAIEERRDQTGHQAFSRQLSGFAKKAMETLDQGGEPIYAGGDDVMAFLPLHIALQRMLEVRREFSKAMGDLTFSAGLAVCHALDPLSEALERAREAEGWAKTVERKNGLCVTVVPRSGAAVTVKGKWELADHLDEIAKLYVGRHLTLSLAHEFRALLAEWAKAGDSTRGTLDRHLPAMAKAIASKKATSAEAVRLVEKHVHGERPRSSLDYLTKCLFVARPFARSMREAGAE